MKKIYAILFLLFSLIILVSCTENVELILENTNEKFFELNETIDASIYKVTLKINGTETNNLPITDSRFEVTGLVDGKLDTSTLGEKEIVVKYNEVELKINYEVVDYVVNNYEELVNAVNGEGKYIVLMKDIVVTDGATAIHIKKGKEKVLELNGHSLSFASNLSSATDLIKNEGTLTIKDCTDVNKDGTGKGLITNKALNPDKTHEFPYYANNTISNFGNLIIESGYLENTTEGGASYVIDNLSTINNAILQINGGKIVSPKNFAVRLYANSTIYKNTVTITNGILEGIRAIWLQLPGSSGEKKLAEINISGGTLKSIDIEYYLAIYSYTFGDSFENTNINISGGTFIGNIAFTGGTKKIPTENVSITGGYFKGNYGVYSYGNMEPFIKGGRIVADPSEYVDLNTYEVNIVDGEYVVNERKIG